MPPSPIPAGLFPSDRLVDWRNNVGVEGGIPNRATIRNCVNADGVPTDGVTDAKSKIQTCLANAATNGVAYLPAGTYVLKSTLTIPANKSLRGDGRTKTIISAEAGLDEVIHIGAGYSDTPLIDIQSGYTRDSSEFTLASASTINTGDFLLLNELNDTSIPVSPQSDAPGEGECSWCDQFGATRLRAQVVKVTGKSGNKINISPGKLFYTFAQSRQPKAMRLDNMTQFSGVEDLTVRNGKGAGSGQRININLVGAANSWVKNVGIDTCGKRCIDLRTYYYRLEIRDSYITKCKDHDNSDTCYGTEIAEGSNSLIENNIYFDTSNGPLIMWGASGNVISYNYIHSVFRFAQRDSWFWPNSWSHGAHTSYNLWEGNDFSGLNWDGYWGSSSHNMAFRNRISGQNPLQGLQPGHIEVAAILIESNNNYMSVVGNVLGTTGWTDKYEEINNLYWSTNPVYSTGIRGDTKAFSTLFRHQNYDYFTKSVKKCGDSGEPPCQGGGASGPLPPSLYLNGKPAWFGTTPFPPFDPNGPTVSDIPAKVRFNSGG